MNIVGEMQVNGRPYAIVDNVGGYVHGVYARYLLTPMACVEKTLKDMVEVVDNEPSDRAEEPKIPSDEPTTQLDDQGVRDIEAGPEVSE